VCVDVRPEPLTYRRALHGAYVSVSQVVTGRPAGGGDDLRRRTGHLIRPWEPLFGVEQGRERFVSPASVSICGSIIEAHGAQSLFVECYTRGARSDSLSTHTGGDDDYA